MKDYPNAAAAYLEASKNPEAPVWVKPWPRASRKRAARSKPRA